MIEKKPQLCSQSGKLPEAFPLKVIGLPVRG
jgi:hypothetical protein